MENTTEERMENTTETRMGGMDMSDKKMNAESLRGTVRVLLSAVCFSTGGVLIKSIPWSSVTIQGARSIFSVLVVGCYMLLRRQKYVWNKTVLFGAVCNTVMAFAFVAATKLTTAANAIVLQFTEPVFVILLMWLIFHKKPGRDAVFSAVNSSPQALRGSLCRDSLLLLYVAGCRSHGGESACDSLRSCLCACDDAEEIPRRGL